MLHHKELVGDNIGGVSPLSQQVPVHILDVFHFHVDVPRREKRRLAKHQGQLQANVFRHVKIFPSFLPEVVERDVQDCRAYKQKFGWICGEAGHEADRG